MLEYLKRETNYKSTENGGVTHKTSGSKVLDYFSQGSALRNRDYDSIVDLVDAAFAEDALLTLKVLFNSRDIRGGQGERDTFRGILYHLAINETETLAKNIHLIPEFGRWDDLLFLYHTPLEEKAISLIKKQLEEDRHSDNPSLCAKWMPSENATSKNTRLLALRTMKGLGMKPRTYRKLLSSLRKKIELVETKITEKRYSDIEYDKIPSQAGMKYRNAFIRNDEHRYQDYLEKLKSGEKTINVGTLNPHEIVRKAMRVYNLGDSEERDLLNAMWDNLPNYLEGKSSNTLPVIDVSGSMAGVPMEMAVSLGLYMSERLEGAYKNHFITFDEQPSLLEIKGKDFVDKVKNIIRSPWGGSTNIEATFDLILDTAIKNNLPQSELPERVVIISDMEFDRIEHDSYYDYKLRRWVDRPATNFDIVKKKFEDAGYTLPRLVFWNVDSRQDNIPMTMEENVQLVSGPSPKLFEQILKDLTAYDLMLEILNNDRYDSIRI